MAEMDSWGSARRGIRRTGELYLRPRDLGPVLQFLEAAVGHLVSRVDSLHRGLTVIRDTGFDRTLHCLFALVVLLNQVNEILISVVLNGRRGNQHLVLKSSDQQSRIHKL